MKTATITFHASHNYGSNLQAYALQRTLVSLNHENVIINLRTERQKDLYTVFTKRKGIKYFIKNLSHLFYYFPLRKAYVRFEDFINNKLLLTKEFRTEEELENAELNYDAYISGSDQIWNPVPADFDWSFYLPFVKKRKKISYATSFGQLAAVGNVEIQKRIISYLKDYDSISVREKRAADNVLKLIGEAPPIVLDPTLLLSKESWLDLIKEQKRIVDKEYIFFYTLFADPERMKIVKRMSKLLKLPVVVSNFSNQYDVINPFIKRYDSGPLEFLTLIRDAKLIIVSSFHGTAFSILFNKPFFAIDGMSDARIGSLLQLTGFENREIKTSNIEQQSENAFNIDFMESNRNIEAARKHSIAFLKKNIEND